MDACEYETMYQVEETHWWYRALHRLIFWQLQKAIPRWQDAAILDAGCGTGAILHQLGNRERHVGVDLSLDALRFCHKRGLNNVKQADIASLPFEDGCFDAVICSSVLYHKWVPNVATALNELNRVLRPGGYLLLNLPAFNSLHSPHDEAVFGVRRFTRPEVIALLGENGYSVCFATYWTCLLFPIAWVARFLGFSNKGRDFEQRGSLKRAVLNRVMDFELTLLKAFSLPFGVALFCVARKGNVKTDLRCR